MQEFSLLLLGNESVGKTSFFKTATGKSQDYNFMYYSTIGVDYELIKIPFENEKIANIKLWDTAGAKLLRHVSCSYIRNTNIILLFFDITNKYSYDSIYEYWLEQILKNGNPKIIYLIGTHSDQLKERTVSLTAILRRAKSLDIPYYEITSHSGFDVGNILIKICKDIKGTNKEKIFQRNLKIKNWLQKQSHQEEKKDNSEEEYLNYKCFFCF